jgi:serine phosphatase RsbU (regulator of sigma subunit)
MASMLSRIINLGTDSEMKQFKAERVKTFNRIVLIFIAAYLSTLPVIFYLDIRFLPYFLIILTLLLWLPLYFCHKQKMVWARYSLTLNAWVLIFTLSVYLGEGGGHVFTLITSAVLWFIIYNNKVEIIIIEMLNALVAVAVLYVYYQFEPVWQGDQAILFPLKIMLITLSIAVAMFTIGVFKTNNYTFVKIVNQQKIEIEERKEQIDASIRYAQGIQRGLLPKDKELDNYLIQNFVYYVPKDVVSGDFYWIHEDEKRAFIALGDSTGHGVPGAMVSVLGMSSLDSIIEHKDVKSPADLLDALDKDFMNKMSKSDLNDGIDISVVMYDKLSKKWQFSSANNSIIVCYDAEVEIIKGDKVPIGHYMTKIEHFTNHDLEVENGDKIFLYSDGYRDQFGGEKGKKFGFKRFTSLVQDVSKYPFDERGQIIHNTFEEWKGSFYQIDDVAVVGIEIS